MDLWIRSQSKKTLTKVNELYIDETTIKANYKCYYSGCDYRILGEYKAEERALEVLDEIQDLLHPKYLAKAKSLLKPEDVKHGKNILEDINECGFVTSIPQFDVEPINTGIVVYNMPKE